MIGRDSQQVCVLHEHRITVDRTEFECGCRRRRREQAVQFIGTAWVKGALKIIAD